MLLTKPSMCLFGCLYVVLNFVSPSGERIALGTSVHICCKQSDGDSVEEEEEDRV